MFVGWEGVGLCSYLLIGFWFTDREKADAGKKAFIVNRIGDFGFLIGMFLLYSAFGTLDFVPVFHQAATGLVYAGPLVTAVTLFFFLGATGKSAQIPLYIWLPDAMAGPTPVSALIHAATMVTAGVYMVARSSVLYALSPVGSATVAGVGALTAFFAATIALKQYDIKKVLAYSTVSQLGYMFLAAGLGAYWVAIFHVATHAFFKALLFLGSGSVIHAMGGEQDMRKMGGLRSHLPITCWTFVIATLAIAGIPPLAGFFSKDAILASAFAEERYALWAIGFITAGLTAFYMSRAVLMTFFGSFRGSEEQHHHLHESPRSMTVPLVVLAVGSVIAGLIGPPPVTAAVGEAAGHGEHMSHGLEWLLILASVLVAVVGMMVAWKIYGGRQGLAGGEAIAVRFAPIHRLLVNKYYVDELYDATVVRGFWGTARGLFRFDAGFIDGFLVNGSRHLTVAVSMLSGFFDKSFVDGLVNAVGWVLRLFSRFLRRLQTGLVSQYAFVMVMGVLALICVYLLVTVR
jgi:NADH-quinone oxidoreductase subunit L